MDLPRDRAPFAWSLTRVQRLLAAILLLACTYPVWQPTLALLTAPPPSAISTYSEDFNAGVLGGEATITGFTPCPNGLCLGPGTSGTLLYRVPGGSGDWLGLAVWLYLPEGGSNELSISSNGSDFQELSRNAHLLASRFYVELHSGAPPTLVRIRVNNVSDRQALAVDKLTFDYLAGTPRNAVSGTAIVAAVLCVGIAVAVLLPSPAFGAGLAVIVALGAVSRLGELGRLADFPLDPDAQGYLEFADQMKLFSPTGFYSGLWSQREPLYILAVRLFMKVAGSSPFHLRIMTALLSLLTIVVVALAAKRLMGNLPGLVAGGLVAFAQPLQREAARGLRLELEIILYIGFLLAAFSATRIRGSLRAVILGVGGGALILLRSTYLPVVLALNVIALLPGRRDRGFSVRLLAAVLLPLLLVAPHRYGLYRVHGDPFYDTKLYARWNANFEFAGQHGFPSLSELQSNGYLGQPITYADYLFGMHSAKDLLVGTARGFAKLFARMDLVIGFPNAVNVLFQLAAIAGLIAAARDDRLWWIPLAFFLVETPGAFLYDRGLLEIYRHTFVGFPLLALAVCVLIERVRTSARHVRSSSL